VERELRLGLLRELTVAGAVGAVPFGLVRPPDPPMAPVVERLSQALHAATRDASARPLIDSSSYR